MKKSKKFVRQIIFSLLVSVIFLLNVSIGNAAGTVASNGNDENSGLETDVSILSAGSVDPITINGLKAEYYTNLGPDKFYFGEKMATIIDPQINFGSLTGVFRNLVGRDEFVNVRWTGQITPEFSEVYTFSMIGDNGFKLWIDNKLVIDHWVNDWDNEIIGTPIALEAGRKYDFKIEYFQATGGANLFLRWESASVPKQIVPVEVFNLPADYEYHGPVSGKVFADGLHAELTFAEDLKALGSDMLEQLSVNVQGMTWPIVSSVLKPGDAKTIEIEFEYPVYSKDSPTANIVYSGGGALVYASSNSKVEEFFFSMKNLSEYQIETPWASQVDENNPLPEYPRPQMVREKWLNLNGKWEFQAAKEGDLLPTGQTLEEIIVVPFAVESSLSGIQRNEERMWYKRSFRVPQDWDGQRVKLNFGAVDYLATVYVNGVELGTHKGGYTSFSFDITDYLVAGDNELIVHVFDQTDRAGTQIIGKQTVVNPGGIWYTPVSGIWQTVWLEPVAESTIDRMDMVPDIWNEQLKLSVDVINGEGKTIEAVALMEGSEVGRISGNADEKELLLPVPDARLWSPDDPFLYDLKIYLKDGDMIVDEVDSYFGMREIKLGIVDGIQRPLLNGEFIFQMGPLDQGYWPDGLYTPPTEDALKFDIEAVKRLNMNMIRKHIKVEPARWYYWADKLGVLVWQDMPNGRNHTEEAKVQFYKELNEMVHQLQNSPSIIVYTVFNEGWGQFDQGGPQTRAAIAYAKELDPTRLINGASGWHDAGGGQNEAYAGHLFDYHSYPAPNSPTPSEYRAAVLGEYGGLGLHAPGHEWSPLVFSYQLMSSKEQLTNEYIKFINTIKNLKEKPGLSAAVYTQITDVEYEINGLLTYDRKVEKVDFERVAAAHRDLIGTINKNDLRNKIEAVEHILAQVKVGNGPGQYPEAAVAEILAATEGVRAIYEDIGAGTGEIKQGIAALNTALEEFLGKVNDPIPKDTDVDHFDSEQLDPSWKVQNEDKSKWSLSENPGKLTIHSLKGDMHERSNDIKNVFVKDVNTDDFEITAKITAEVYKNYQQAGLVVWQDIDNYVKFAHAWDTAGSTGKSLETAYEKSGRYNKAANMASHPGSDTVYLKIRKQGDVYTTYYWDGVNWAQASDPVTVSLYNPKVGIYTFSSLDDVSVEAKFDYFTVLEKTVVEISYDLNNDGRISVGDLAIISRFYEATDSHEDWEAIKEADLNEDGKIDLEDIQMMVERILLDSP